METIAATMNQAIQAYRAGNLSSAEQACQSVVERQPDCVPALHLLGMIAYQTGNLEQAIAHYQTLLTVKPDHFEAHANLAIALQKQDNVPLAVHHFQQALLLNPNHAVLQFNLGNLLVKQQDLAGAIAYFRRAIALQPDYAAAYENLGSALQAQGDLPAALVALQQALRLQPDSMALHYKLGDVREALNQVAEAVQHYRQALALNPKQAAVHNHLALALRRLKQPVAAIAHLRQAIALQPNDPQTHNNLGVLLQEQNLLDEAILHCEQAIALDPAYAAAHLNLGLAALATGDFRRGFAEHEWRFQVEGPPLPANLGTAWDGSDLQGRTLLVLMEQGFGDTLQFIRYVPLLAQCGGQVLVYCQPQLVRLFAAVPGIATLLQRGDPLPPVDVYAFSMSLPHLLGDRLETAVPNQVPYLTALQKEDPLPAALRERSPELKIGLVWASGRPKAQLNPRRYELQIQSHQNRSLPLPWLVRALTVRSDIQLFSLQVGAHAADLAQLALDPVGGTLPVQNLSESLKDFADTAAAIAHLDLVISVDTAVAHLAGAMGKPVWVLLPYYADWRWMLERDDTPWYPTMRLFRQTQPEHWHSALRQVAQALASFEPAGEP